MATRRKPAKGAQDVLAPTPSEIEPLPALRPIGPLPGPSVLPRQPIDPLKSDFRNFLFVIWRHLRLPSPTAIQYDIALYLQHGPRRRIIEAFRGVGKSWITAAYVLWLLYKDPNERILVVSASKDRADSFSIFCKRLLNEVPLLMHLKPRDGQRDSNIAFDVGPSDPHQAPSVRSIGITGQITGGRATRIIADDVEVPKNALTQTMRDRLAESVKEFDAVLTPGGEITYLGTPQCEMSLYNILPQRGYELRVWPARYPGSDELKFYGERLAPMIKAALAERPDLGQTGLGGRGVPTEPTRFGEEDLIEREGSYGRSGFKMQFQLLTNLSDQDKFPLKLSDFLVFPVDLKQAPVTMAWGSGPTCSINDLACVGLQGDRWNRPIFVSTDWAPYQGVVMAIDPAGKGGDELGYAVVAMLNGHLYILACKGLKGGYSDGNLQHLADTAKLCGVKKIIIEENFGGGMFTKLLTPFLTRTYPCTTEDITSSKQKELRIIDTLEPVLNQHKLVVSEALVRQDMENYNEYGEDVSHRYQLFYQLSRITKERGSLSKDDRADVLAMAVAYWWELMDKDQKKAEQEHRANLMDQELRQFHLDVFGGSERALNWCIS